MEIVEGLEAAIDTAGGVLAVGNFDGCTADIGAY